ncbi:hypothetical protein V8F06_008778 [Rhypophila decipiens]
MGDTTGLVFEFKKRQRKVRSIKRRETPSGGESDCSASSDDVRRPHRDKKSKTETGTPARSVGPARVASNIRTTVVTDYSADVCKDASADSVTTANSSTAGEDYKQGWQLDREWESVTKGRQNLGGSTVAHADRRSRAVDENDEPADDIPLTCAICGETCRLPVVTRCGHSFCESCALRRYRKDPNCAVCGAATNGIFNSSKHLERKHEQKGDRSAE